MPTIALPRCRRLCGRSTANAAGVCSACLRGQPDIWELQRRRRREKQLAGDVLELASQLPEALPRALAYMVRQRGSRRNSRTLK